MGVVREVKSGEVDTISPDAAPMQTHPAPASRRSQCFRSRISLMIPVRITSLTDWLKLCRTALSRFRSLFVIARQSRFHLQGQDCGRCQTGRTRTRRALCARRQRAQERRALEGVLGCIWWMRGTAAHIWADRLDGALDDMFDLQVRSRDRWSARSRRSSIAPRWNVQAGRSTGDIDAVTAYYRGLPHTEFPTRAASNDCAMQHFKRAIALDSSFAPAYGGDVESCLGWRRANKSAGAMSPKTTPSYCGLPVG